MKCRLFGLFIWTKDDPMTGSILSLSNIDSPRKDFSEYCVGESVQAQLKGFGIHEGVIGMIGDEESKKNMLDIINDHDRFMDLICKVLKDEDLKKKRKLMMSKQTPSPKKKKTSKGKKDNCDEVVSSKDSTKNTANPNPKASKQTTQVNLLQAAEAQRLFEMELLAGKETAMDSEETQCDSPMVAVGNALSVINEESTVPQTTLADQSTICHMEQKMNWLEVQLQQAWQCIYELQQNVAWLKQNQTCTSAFKPYAAATESYENNTVSDIAQSPANVDVMGQNKERLTEVSPPLLDKPVEDRVMYNNYTKDQLYQMVVGSSDYSKGAKTLFRKLYAPEEIAGHSLTGTAANKSTPARPALEDQEKLRVIYEVVKRKWSFVTQAMVNSKIGELLKPSRNNMSK